MTNPYIASLQVKYDALKDSIAGLQTRAVDDKRDLTADELRSVNEQAATAKSLGEQITSLTEIETRNAEISKIASALPTVETRNVSNTSAVDRDPGLYTRSSENSFFADLNSARQGDGDAATRLAQHNRALNTGAAGNGVVAPHWLTEEFAEIARQSRRVASAVRKVDLGNDPRPLTLPRQTAGTDAVVQFQAAENDPVLSTDAWDSDVDTIVPRAISGSQIVSRQMIDMSSPQIDQLIFGDLLAAYSTKVEALVVSTMITAAGAAQQTFASNAALVTAAGDAYIDAAIAVRNARKLPADVAIMNLARYGQVLKLKDTTGRPLVPGDSGGAVNVLGTGTVQVDGRFEGLNILATDGVPSTYPESILIARASDTILFESQALRFKFEEQFGPESVRLGVWGYAAATTRYPGASVKRLVVTAA